MADITVLGIDPGSRKLGYGIVRRSSGGALSATHFGVLSLSGKLTFTERLLRIHQGVIELIEDFMPDAFSIEKAFVGESPSSSMKLGEARAAAILAAGRLALPVFEITPSEAKKAVTGSGRADKARVRDMVVCQLGLERSPAFDASDALAIALSYLYRRDRDDHLGAAAGLPGVTRKPKKRKGRRGGWTAAEVAALGLETRQA